MFDYPLRTLHRYAGYVRQRAPGGVIILRLSDSSRASVDAWYQDCLQIMATWQPDIRLRYLHDVRGAGFPAPYVMDKAVQVLRRMGYIRVSDGRGAILTGSQILGKLLETNIRPRAHAMWLIRSFTDESDALTWLRM